MEIFITFLECERQSGKKHGHACWKIEQVTGLHFTPVVSTSSR